MAVDRHRCGSDEQDEIAASSQVRAWRVSLLARGKSIQFSILQPVLTPSWQLTVDFQITTTTKDGDLFAVWYLMTPAKTHKTKRFGDFGYVEKFNGVGVFVYAEQDQWYMHAI